MPLRMLKEQTPPRISNVIAVAAGKGGVGKSTVTVNLARALKKLGYTVGIMDTDIYGPSIRKMMPEDRLPQQHGEVITPAFCDGIRMISMAYFRKEHEAAAIRAPIANGIISQFIKSVDWGPLDYLLIDFPPGTGDVQLTLCQQANLTGALMVTTPQEVAVMDVRKAMHLFEQVKIPLIGVLENMSYFDNGGEKKYLFGFGGGDKLARESGLPFLGELPIASTISKSGDTGKSLFDSPQPEDAHVANILIDITKTMIAQMDLIKKSQEHRLQGFELNWRSM